MTPFYITLDNGSGELTREPVSNDEGTEGLDPFKVAIERLVARVGFFAPGDTIKVIEG